MGTEVSDWYIEKYWMPDKWYLLGGWNQRKSHKDDREAEWYWEGEFLLNFINEFFILIIIKSFYSGTWEFEQISIKVLHRNFKSWAR